MAMEPAGADRNAVFSRCARDGLVLGVVSGTAAAPVLGTIVGAVVGVILAIPVALVAGAAIASSVGASGAEQSFRRRVDVVFAVLGIGTAALAVGWISLDPLVGPWPALAMFAVVAIGLLVLRPRLQRLTAPPAG